MEQVEIEELAFLYLCNSKDRAYISGEEKIPITDFVRLNYIVSSLGFGELELRLWRKQGQETIDKLEALLNVYERETIIEDESDDDQYEQERYMAWITEFCSTAPTEQLKERLMELFEIDN